MAYILFSAWLLLTSLLLRAILLSLIWGNSNLLRMRKTLLHIHLLVYFQIYILNVRYDSCYEKWRNLKKRKTKRLRNSHQKVLLLHGVKNWFTNLALLSWLTYLKAFIYFNWNTDSLVTKYWFCSHPIIVLLHVFPFFNYSIISVQ